MFLNETDLPLLSSTPEAWAAMALENPCALLSDHAYLEKKAASNALELLNRWPEPTCPDEWTQTLSAIASDESAHLNSVIRILTQRGGRLERTHRNDYAHRLRLQVRKGRGNEELLDRLLISALIEVRSCERFMVMARYCADRDPVLSRFYHRLGSSELGHYKVFLHLAGLVMSEVEVESRWHVLLEIECQALAAQPPGPRIHSGWTADAI